METTLGRPAVGDMQLLWARLATMLLGIPLTQMNLHLGPRWLSDYNFGLMSRLGVCFGVAVLVWCWGFTRQRLHWRSPVFVVASMISANAAYATDQLVPSGWGMLAIVSTGAMLLSLSQKLILEYSWLRMMVASVAAPGLFYFVLYSGRLGPESMHGSIENYALFLASRISAGNVCDSRFLREKSRLATALIADARHFEHGIR